MIEGLHFDMSSSEIKTHIQERAVHHKRKGEWYEKRASELAEGIQNAEMQPSNNPIHSLTSSAKSHNEKGALFQFMADHVIPGETYRLSENDLARLEIIARFF